MNNVKGLTMDGLIKMIAWLVWVKENCDIDTNAKGRAIYINQNADTEPIAIIKWCKNDDIR